jgi:hypothetical protein
MAVNTLNRQFKAEKNGLTYDADSVMLIGKYNDELSAHRGKKQWVEVLNSYFLLEPDRDYEMWVTSSAGDGYFAISCCFLSACGRYAFWRLVNQQAPEAEAKLGSTMGPNLKRQINTKKSPTPFVLSAIEDAQAATSETCNLLKRMVKFFQS